MTERRGPSEPVNEPAADLERRRLARGDVYAGRLRADGLAPAGMLARALRVVAELLRPPGQRAERELERRLAATAAGLTRSNAVCVLSPKGGVGKTTCTLLIGDLLARHARLRCLAVDANPDYGTLGSLAPDHRRAQHTLADLLGDLDRAASAAELRSYVSVLDGGLHLLAAPAGAEQMAQLGAEDYQRLAGHLRRFYDVVLLDCGTGLSDPLARAALSIADQAVVVATPEWVTADRVLAALADLEAGVDRRLVLVLNQAPAKDAVDRQVIESAFAHQQLAARVAIGYDPRLRELLDAGAYDPAALSRSTRMAIGRLALAVAEGLR